MQFNTHAAVKTLTAAGAPEPLAAAVVTMTQEAVAAGGRELATRSDLAALRADVGRDMTTLRADVGRDLAALELRLVKWIVGAVLAGTTATVAVLRLLG